MRLLLLGLFVCICVQSTFAQTSSLKGKIVDTLDKKNLPNAVITLLQKSDSTLYKFTRTDKQGDFRIDNVQPGKYILLITYPKFADFSDELEIKNQPENDLGNVPLTLASQLLQAVIIKNNSPIRIKGDTTEFLADSFHVKDGATVEDLLKKLPGFQVNSKGEITAQGQKVQKVLVDGEEFFGNDPTMATQNIAAKAVDKVQVFDTKSEQQQLTGITNNSDGKTLNIKLKEDKKKGSFGKAYAGTDFSKYYDAKALFNNFVGKKKISAYLTKSNVNAGSLDWGDRQKLGIENDMEYDEINGYYYSFGSSDEFSDWNVRGLPSSYTAGALFSNKWNAEKQGLNSSYRYNRLQTTNEASTRTQNILDNTINYRNKATSTQALNEQHALNGKYEWKIDSLASIKFSTADIYKTSELHSNTNSEYLNAIKDPINRSYQSINNNTNRKQSDNQLTYKQLFKKKDRLWLTTARFGYTEDHQKGFYLTNTDFYKDGQLDSTDLLDQMKKFDGNSTTVGIKTTFSEPLSSKLNLILSYSYDQNNSSSNRNTFNKSTNNGKYENIDTLYSNNFDLKASSNNGSLIFKFTDKKLRFSAGSGISSVGLRLFDKGKNNRTTYNFLNLTPQAQASYAFKPQTRLSLGYRGTTRQPRINQLQPIRDNNDPLNIFIGNPDLKVGFTHSINAFFNQYKVLKGTGIWVSGNYNFVNNDITEFNILDTATGKQYYQPVNVNGNRNWNFWAQYNRGEGEKKFRHGLEMNGNGGRNINFVNGKKNSTDYSTFQVGIPVGYDYPEKFNFYFRPAISYNRSQSSLQPNAKNNYYSLNTNVYSFVMLPGKFELSNDLNGNWQQRINGFTRGTNIFVWNASLGHKIFKDKSGKIILMANDILDQNKGFDRNISSNFIQEDRYSRISRYFLLKFEWTFNKMPGTEKK